MAATNRRLSSRIVELLKSFSNLFVSVARMPGKSGVLAHELFRQRPVKRRLDRPSHALVAKSLAAPRANQIA
jgi:hypothetical protein